VASRREWLSPRAAANLDALTPSPRDARAFRGTIENLARRSTRYGSPART